MDSFWDFLWLIIISFAFIAYLILLFSIITDLFRDHKTSGWVKAIWIVFLFFIPLLTSLVYLIVRSDGMAQRSLEAAQQSRTHRTATSVRLPESPRPNPSQMQRHFSTPAPSVKKNSQH